jgi:hypothetical protein
VHLKVNESTARYTYLSTAKSQSQAKLSREYNFKQMEQITIQLPKSISNELDTYAQEHQTSASAIAQRAIEEFLLGQGYLSKPQKPFRLIPSAQGVDIQIHLIITMQS